MAYGKKEFNFETHPMESFIFFDIETVSKVPELMEGTDLYHAFEYKMRYAEEAQRKDFSAYNLKALYANKAALYPEYGKVVAITVGKIVNEEVVLYTFSQNDEGTLLDKFQRFLADKIAEDPKTVLCGVNLKFFDLRYCYIRSIVNQVKPVVGHINLNGLKPWELYVCDITDIWKQTSSYNAPLSSIAECLGLPSPKADMDGSMTSEVYWKEGAEGLKRIVKYCEADVFTTINIVRKLRFLPILEVGGNKTPKETKKAPVEKAEQTQVEEKTPAVFNTSLPPFLTKLYNMNNFDEVLEKELREMIGKKKLTKADKENLKIILLGVYLRTDFINMDQDSKAVKDQKTEEVDNFINSL